MTTNKLGLPAEYRKLPQYFDAWNVNEDTDRKNAFIESLLSKYNVHSTLDLTCGTGSQVFFLAKLGYEVTGCDFSPSLLEIARKKASQEKRNIKFIDGDMRSLKVGQFDSVITIFNAVGHLTKAGFAKAMRNIHHNLKAGGIYIFDIFNLESLGDSAIADLACYVHKKIGETQILATQCSMLDRQKGIVTSYDTYQIQKKAEKPKRFYNKFSLQIYTAGELETMLTENGFEVLELYDMDGSPFVPSRSKSIVTVARKK